MNKSSTQRNLPLIMKEKFINFRNKNILSQGSSPTYSTLYNQNPLGHDSLINVFEESKDGHRPGTTGPFARLDFYNDYKNIIRLSERSKLVKEDSSSNIAYLSQVELKKLKPKAFGLVKNSGAESVIDLRMFSMGDNYASAFSQGLKHYPFLQTLNLKGNRLTDAGNEKILATVDVKQLKRLNLSENKLGPKSLEKIIDIMSVYHCKLKYLNLEKTEFGDSLIIGLCNVLGYNKSLTKLVLAKNNLSDRIAKNIKEMLVSNKTLQVLDLHWNVFRAYGAGIIFEGLTQNSTLLILDFSWNSIGKNEKCTETISASLKVNTSLAHLDLSYCSLNVKDCKILAEALKSNHSLLGIHTVGNCCSIDPKGFLVIENNPSIDSGLFYKRIVDKKKFLHEIAANCWVCEKWVEQTFVCESSGNSVFVHFDFEGYKPEIMYNTSKNIHEITRAVPNRALKFFFTEINGAQIFTNYEKIQEKIETSVTFYEGIKVDLHVDVVEKIVPDGDVCNIKSPFPTKPRIAKAKPLPPSNQLERIKWHIRNSIFKEYVFDSEKLNNECFEFDWKYSRLANFVRNSEDQTHLKNCIKKYYGLIKDAYKTLRAYSGNDIFSIGSNILTDFLNQCKIFDSLYGANDFGVNLNSTLVQKDKGQLFNPGNSLVRYEFVEILVRIAVDRYIRSKICEKTYEAFGKLMEDQVSSVLSTYSSEKWRNEDYLTEEVDLVMRANKELFVELFKKYSGKYTLPGKKNFMSLEEFRIFCIHACLVGDNFATREIDVCFSRAMMTQVDELYFKRHMEMSFVEFLEAFARALDVSESVSQSSYKFNSIIQNRLSRKIETFLPWALTLCPASFQDDFKLATSEAYTRMMYKLAS